MTNAGDFLKMQGTLGLARSSGFNPFGNMRSSYSMWPIFVIPYNFPPWSCMQESNFMMALLIPGPRSPGKKNFDVFLQPLIEELLSLCAVLIMIDARRKRFQASCCRVVVHS